MFILVYAERELWALEYVWELLETIDSYGDGLLFRLSFVFSGLVAVAVRRAWGRVKYLLKNSYSLNCICIS